MAKIICIILIPLFFTLPVCAQQPAAYDSITELEAVTVSAGSPRNRAMQTAYSRQIIEGSWVEQNLAGSLMQSLESLPGIQAASIGAGQSRPAIRGLGFNRMIVAEDGIKHEGQPWGEEHGLEIDQFAIDEVEIIKGAGALRYGSDAIGGVINVRHGEAPLRRLEGKINLTARSVNESVGVAAQVAGRGRRFWYRATMTLVDYADAQVQADSIQYYSYYIKLHDRRLRNTAGKEQNAGLAAGYAGDKFRTTFLISNVYAKNGFFANAHGLEVRLSGIDYDRRRRDIDLPYHSVNHFKISNHSEWQSGRWRVEARAAYQQNGRDECSEPVSHGYMPVPPNTLERQFKKATYSAGAELTYLLGSRQSLHAGIDAEHQQNRRGGWGFIIPDFRTTAAGAYALDRFLLSDDLILTAGVRFDRIATRIEPYRDWYRTPVAGGDSVYLPRAARLQRTFTCVTWSVGVNYRVKQWTLKANVGKSFRAPIPKELGADGVNYGIFRYEKGAAGLSPEESYQLDAGIRWDNGRVELLVEPFWNYFPNYIYLNPTAEYREGLQLYAHTQSRVFRWGFEATVDWRVADKIRAALTSEYVYARQLSGDKEGYSLPFSPPAAATLRLQYTPQTAWAGADGFIAVHYKIVGSQYEIVPPEKPTDGYRTLALTAGRSFRWGGQQLRFTLRGENLLNTTYFDHTSYYRLLDVPEPGRSVSLLVGWQF
ncbi:MAG: TonB-dependent receptor [Prevotellaceae bacterium]|nr:TonB-dependent receptor [Prevotellaceae bacterium]